MNEGDDLLGKADALLGRYRGSSAPDFPVLTEVVEQPHPEMSHAGKAVDTEDRLRNRGDALEPKLRDLEVRIFERVLSTVEPQIADLVGAPLREQIKSLLDSVLADVSDKIAEGIRSDLAELVREAVSGAIQQELSATRARDERS